MLVSVKPEVSGTLYGYNVISAKSFKSVKQSTDYNKQRRMIMVSTM